MSTTQPTQTTKDIISETFSRRRGRPAKIETEAEATQVATETALNMAEPATDTTTKWQAVHFVDLAKISAPTPEQHEKHLRIAAKRTELESAITYAKQSGIEWLEVDEETLASFCGGKLPDTRYVWFKDVRLCLPNTAEDIAKKESLTCHEILFASEGYMKVGVRRAEKV